MNENLTWETFEEDAYNKFGVDISNLLFMSKFKKFESPQLDNNFIENSSNKNMRLYQYFSPEGIRDLEMVADTILALVIEPNDKKYHLSAEFVNSILYKIYKNETSNFYFNQVILYNNNRINSSEYLTQFLSDDIKTASNYNYENCIFNSLEKLINKLNNLIDDHSSFIKIINIKFSFYQNKAFNVQASFNITTNMWE